MGTDAAEWAWAKYFLRIAIAVSRKSKDTTKVGAVIATPEDRLIIATGFNGLPRHLSSQFEKQVIQDQPEKLCWMVHAEANAVFNAARTGSRTPGCKLYVNKFPCYGCMQAIIQAGITHVYTNDKAYWKNDPLDTSHDGKRFLINSGAFKLIAPNHPELKEPAPQAPPRLSKPPTEPPRRDSAPPSQNHH
jgi:dCMP deaminase